MIQIRREVASEIAFLVTVFVSRIKSQVGFANLSSQEEGAPKKHEAKHLTGTLDGLCN